MQVSEHVSWLCCFAASINLCRLEKTMSDTFSTDDPVPASVPAETGVVPEEKAQDKAPAERPALDPTRYGDWEKNGRCIDF